jgi:glutamine---fructose-6-phosphate transaminase (isomerizing)
MRETMIGQAESLACLLDDREAVESVADRLRARHVLVIGTGTSWHAAEQSAYLLRAAGLEVAA